MSTQVQLEVDNRIARLTFTSDNGVQILGPETRARLANVLTDLESRSDFSVVLFSATGRTFIAGADINQLKSLDVSTARDVAREGQRLMQRVADLPAVTVAAIHAACAGGGCELALACDMRMASTSARIGLPEVTLGVIPGWGGLVRATRLFGGAVARRMILSGELLDAATCLQLGIVDCVHTDEELADAVQNRIELLVQRGPQSQVIAKRLIQRIEGEGIRTELELEAAEFAACYRTGEPFEGCAAFLEKRLPNWTS